MASRMEDCGGCSNTLNFGLPAHQGVVYGERCTAASRMGKGYWPQSQRVAILEYLQLWSRVADVQLVDEVDDSFG